MANQKVVLDNKSLDDINIPTINLNTEINKMEIGTSVPDDDVFYISQNTDHSDTWYKRKHVNIYYYIYNKIKNLFAPNKTNRIILLATDKYIMSGATSLSVKNLLPNYNSLTIDNFIFDFKYYNNALSSSGTTNLTFNLNYTPSTGTISWSRNSSSNTPWFYFNLYYVEDKSSIEILKSSVSLTTNSNGTLEIGNRNLDGIFYNIKSGSASDKDTSDSYNRLNCLNIKKVNNTTLTYGIMSPNNSYVSCSVPVDIIYIKNGYIVRYD